MLRQVTTILDYFGGPRWRLPRQLRALGCIQEDRSTATESRKSSFGIQLEASDSKEFALNEDDRSMYVYIYIYIYIQDANLWVNFLPFAMLHAI